ncbi:MAG: hypothetical protein WDA59_04205 [Methanofastidiosum sp.]
MSKKLEIFRKDYDTIKEIVKNSTCMAVAYKEVGKQYNALYIVRIFE